MPFGHNCEHANFDACVRTMRGKVDNPEAFCGTLMHQTEGHCARMAEQAAFTDAVVKVIQAALAPFEARLKALETIRGVSADATTLDGLMARLTALEALPPPEPGPTGPPGLPGRDGRDGAPGQAGKDGADGLGFDDLEVVQGADERTFTVQMRRGDRLKACGRFVMPALIYREIFEEGQTYERGDSVTYRGSLWIARTKTTETPGDGSSAWRLAVKQGREGKPGPRGEKGADGKDGRAGRDHTHIDPGTGRTW